MTIWFDAGDLVRFYQNAIRPTGIQRFSFETYRAVWTLAGPSGDVGFCRYNPAAKGFEAIHFPALQAGINAATTAAAPVSLPASKPAPSPLRLAARRLPRQYREPLSRLFKATTAAVIASRDLLAAVLSALTPLRAPASRLGGHQFALGGPHITFAPGDWLVQLGASWEQPYDPNLLAWLRASGARLALLAHDLIPELFPEWCTPQMTEDFSRWLRQTVPQTSCMFAVSRNTAQDLAACMRQLGTPLAPAVVLPVGAKPMTPSAAGALVGAPYILMTGTIEPRKNHAAMLRVWRLLLQTLPPEAVPRLVIAGKTGWLANDLMRQFDHAGWLGGKIIFFDQPSDQDLANLYQHCLFSVFPSLYEGWGLPVTESLCHGKPAAVSSRAAVPEAGGDFCAYFDPDHIAQTYEIIRGLIEHPDRIARLQAKIREQYRPPTWNQTASALLTALGCKLPASGEASASFSEEKAAKRLH